MSEYFAAIFGAGICGTALANELNEKGKKVLLIDPFVSENAPGAPGGLVNMAAGMRAKKSWEAEKCYGALRKQIDRLIEYGGRDDLIYDSGVMRPAINEKLLKKYKRSLDKYDWPDHWIHWLEEDEIKQEVPAIADNHGGLFLESGFTVYVDRYLNTYRRYLREQGVDCRYEHAEYHFDDSNKANISFKNGEDASAEHVIIAAGRQTRQFDEWADLPLEDVKGEIIWYEADEKLPWNQAVSAKGYSMRRGENELIVGATYEHNFDDVDITEEARERIEGKVELMFPDLLPRLTKKAQLAGVRVTTPNRLPVIGCHSENKNLCIYSGMNSKGLLFSHYVAGIFIGNLVDGAPIPDDLNVARFHT